MRQAISTAAQQRDRLVAELLAGGKLSTERIAEAFRSVPRHLFVPDVDLNEAYRDEVIFTKSCDGVSLSASSAPSIMAEMLELLDIQPASRVLEIGTGTGYNAALLAELVGPDGRVSTVDIDQDVVDNAERNLRVAGYAERVHVYRNDGGFGVPDSGPYDRIIATVGIWDIPPAWFDQLADDGRIIVPLEFRDVHLLVTFDRRGNRLVSRDVRGCRFVRLRGAFAGPEQQIPLREDGVYLSTTSDEVDRPALAALLSGPATFDEPVPVPLTPEELHHAFRLWLALRLDEFCQVSIEGRALSQPPVRAWSTAADRTVAPAGEHDRFAIAPGLLSRTGFCLVEHDADGRPVVRARGDAELGPRLLAQLRAWHDAGRPFANGVAVEVSRVTDAPEPKPDDAQSLVVKRWFRYLLGPADSAPANSYAYVSFTPPDLSQPIERLIDSARTWRPCAGRVIDSFDFRGHAIRAVPTVEAAPGERPSDDPVQTAHTILSILNRAEYRRGPAEHLDQARGELVPRLTERIARSQPVRVVIPSFPGRPYNPITHQRVAPDLGEAHAFMLLSRISRHVETVYPPGLQFVICLDGTVYNPFYGYTNEADHQYPVDLQRFVDELGVGNAVAIFDLQDLVDERMAEFEALREESYREITAEWAKPDYAFRDELIDAMKMGTNTVAINAAAVYLVKYYDPAMDAAGLIERMRQATVERARTTAFEYMVFLVTIRRMKLIESKLPDALRGTVHPKPGQYSPYLVGRSTKVAPWHGVAILHPDGSIDTVYESEVFSDPGRYTAVFLRGDYTPFYYEETPTAGTAGHQP